MCPTIRSWMSACVAASLIGLCASANSVSAVEITSGVTFGQISYDFPAETDTYSTTGDVTVDPSQIPGIPASGGYVNVFAGGQWIVHNMPVVPGDGASTSNFALPGAADGTQDGSLTAYADFSTTPTFNFSAAPTHAYSVGQEFYGAEGDSAGDPGGGPVPTPTNTVNFVQGGNTTSVTYQFNHPNVDAARNQCAPAAFANNMQWLHDTYGLTLAGQSNTIGLKGSPASSIVANADVDMQRTGITAGDRRTGDGTLRPDNVRGVLQYISDTGHPQVEVKHQGVNSNGAGLGADITNAAVGLTSHGQGNALQFDFILSELQAGHAVELMFKYPTGGGHAVEVVGAGVVLGVPWLWYKSDHVQYDDILGPLNGDGIGTNMLDWSRLGANNVLLDEKGQPVAQFVVTETVPEPSTLVLAAIGLLAVTLTVRRRGR